MYGFAGYNIKHPHAKMSCSYNFSSQVRRRVGYAYHIAHFIIRSWPHNEIRSCQKKEVKDMLFTVSYAVAKFAKFFSCGSGLYAENSVTGFRGSKMMGPWTHSADGCHYPGHFLNRSAETEFFKASQFHSLNER